MAEKLPENLRVTHLIARDFKRIEAIDVCPGGKTLVLLTGLNENGKTSVLDALISALGGKSLSPDMPVRRGADESRITLEIGDKDGKPKYRIVRDFDKDGGDSIKLYDTSEEDDKTPAVRLGKPQTILDALVDDVSFNPLAFAAAKPAEQMEMLLAAAGLREQFEKAQARKATLADERRDLNRKAQELAGKLKGRPALPEKVPEPIHVDEVTKRIEAIREHNEQYDRLQASLGEVYTDEQINADVDAQIKEKNEAITQRKKLIADLQEAIGLIEGDVAALTANRATALEAAKELRAKRQKAIEDHGPRKSADAVQAELEKAREQNLLAAECKATRALMNQASSIEEEIKSVQVGIEAIDESTVEMLNGSSVGKNVPGLAIVNGEIMHNNVPFSQASGMRKLELSALIGMAANPALRIMCLDECDKMDDVSLARLVEMAKERQYQLWATAVRVTSDGDDQLVLSVKNGRVAHASA